MRADLVDADADAFVIKRVPCLHCASGFENSKTKSKYQKPNIYIGYSSLFLCKYRGNAATGNVSGRAG